MKVHSTTGVLSFMVVSSVFFEHQQGSPLQTKVLNSALKLFVEQGFHKTSIPDLVTQSGVSIGSIYKHFGDKEGVAKELMTRLFEALSQQQLAIIAQHSRVQNQYRALVEWMFNFALEFPDVMAFLLYARHQDFLPDTRSACSAKPFMVLRDVIAQGIAQGEIKQQDALIMAAVAFGPVLRILQLYLDGVLPKPLADYRDELIQTSWQAIAR
ncbi:TetR/AcrR family transcriptional regulator [Thiomicrospira sp. R3]|uniref:TetR/AcrR family transcriptional regulator n=1 Tax=Thiomicrospira sp. R3 TaxID=3035472 RepID=UPI00259BD765|nr:TetR/AcrR family transcriptional regulator [Thiomicrospira sp. R3]WFE67746.1 TetR/AcrR family transcriptional regulator [Thiomicrospira sp. R3]